MGTFISVLIIIVSILLILIVLVQNSKGGGLSSSFGASNQVMGVRKTADFLEKATWTLAIALLALSLAATPYSKTSATPNPGENTGAESETRKNVSEKGVNSMAPAPVPQNMQQNPINLPVQPAPPAGEPKKKP